MTEKNEKLSPEELGNKDSVPNKLNRLSLTVRTPYNWKHLLDFYQLRAIDGLEIIDDFRYSRYCTIGQRHAWFRIDFSPLEKKRTSVMVEFELEKLSDLKSLVHTIRRMFDLDTDIHHVENRISAIEPTLIRHSGLRIPGVMNCWEAGVRAIIGQQVSVKAAVGQLNLLVATLSDKKTRVQFPTPEELSVADLSFLRMPQARKDTLNRFAQHMKENSDSHPENWLQLKGIGPWTINYAKLRGLSEPNCFLETDLIVKKALVQFPNLNRQTTSPWGSYALFLLTITIDGEQS